MSLDPLKLSVNTRFLTQELLTRGISLEHLPENPAIVVAKFKNKTEYIVGIASSIVSGSAALLADNKLFSKRIMTRAEISVPTGEEFSYETRFAAMAYGLELGTAAVLKPTIGIHGHDVYLPLESVNEIESAIDAFHESQDQAGFILEEFFPHQEFRIFITKNGQYAALQRDPAYVIGDGKHSIEQLAAIETDQRMNPRKGCLCAIILDRAAELFLAKKNLNSQSIPELDQKVYLRANSNLLTGGTCTDVSDQVHSSVIEICKKTLACFEGLPYAGIDFMTSDISSEQTANSYRIVELNPEPGIGMHMAPWQGKAVNVAAMIADLIFPETSKG